MEKEIQDKLNDLQRQNDELSSKLQGFEDLKKRIDKIERTSNNHRHKGNDSIALELLLKEAQYIDGKEFRASGTKGGTGSIAVGDINPERTIVYKNGLIISIT